MARQRNNITRLPLATRSRICQMLADGAEYDEVRGDTEIQAACAKAGGLKLHNKSFLAYRLSGEYLEYCKMRTGYFDELERRRIAAYVVDQKGGLESVARVATFDLLRNVQSKLSSGYELEPKELALANSVLSNFERNRISAVNCEKRAADDVKEKEYLAKIGNLESKIAELSAKLAENSGERGLSPEVLAEIERKIGMM